MVSDFRDFEIVSMRLVPTEPKRRAYANVRFPGGVVSIGWTCVEHAGSVQVFPPSVLVDRRRWTPAIWIESSTLLRDVRHALAAAFRDELARHPRPETAGAP